MASIIISRMATLEDMQEQLNQLRDELANAKVSGDRPGSVYLLPKEKKLKPFSGASGCDVYSFVEDVKAAIKVRKLEGEDVANFILSHLEGSARREIKHRPESLLTEPSKILDVLQETFGERCTLSSLMRELCNRGQKDGETVPEYAFALMALADKMQNLENAPDLQVTLKEQFRDGLLDPVLRREVKRLMIEEPDVTFLSLRDWALEMAEEVSSLPQRKGTKINLYSVDASENQLTKTLETLSSVVEGQTLILQQIQKEQKELAERVEKLERPRPPWKDRGSLECYRCHKKGHLARECLSPTPAQPSTPSN